MHIYFKLKCLFFRPDEFAPGFVGFFLCFLGQREKIRRGSILESYAAIFYSVKEKTHRFLFGFRNVIEATEMVHKYSLWSVRRQMDKALASQAEGHGF